MRENADIAVLGGGPAGAVAAIRLAGLGYRVALLSGPRRLVAYEGLSERALQGLRAAGCRRALQALGPEARRVATWNGETNAANRERIVDRETFDAALRADAAEAGVLVAPARAESLERGAEGWRVDGRLPGGDRLALTTAFLVEARGRGAPGAKVKRGPATTALTRAFEGCSLKARTAIASFADGWAWFVALGDGKGLLQIFLSSANEGLPKRSGLGAFFEARRREIPEARGWLEEATPAGPVRARNATSKSAARLVARHFLRVGDAAIAIDPLSGHGMFEAVGSALAAAPVINTLLKRPREADLAKTFYTERAQQGFLRYCRIGRDFYALERRFPERPFWAARRAWPDERPAHEPPFSASPVLVRRPVIEEDYVVEREVVVTPDHPRGVWQVDGVALVPLLRFLDEHRAQTRHAVIAAAARRMERAPAQVETALDWLRYRGLFS